jgi:hypothetical protein
VSMPAAIEPVDFDEPALPDELKVPENPDHRRIADAIALAAARGLPADVVLYRDMNWYPLDGRSAMAPDVFALRAGVLVEGDKSYRQAASGGPTPIVAVEIPSESDTFMAFRRKASRYRSLGVDLYVIMSERGTLGALRYAPDDNDFVEWTNRPIEALGNVQIEVVDNRIRVRSVDGYLIESVEDLQSQLGNERAADQRLVTELRERLERAEARLRELGHA